MQAQLLCLLTTVLLIAAPAAAAATIKGEQGIDVSSYQPHVNWSNEKAKGVHFAYIKATEGTSYKSSTFNDQYIGATKANVIRGSYHFALPNKSSGAAQAKYFLKHGGGWSNDGRTLPGALDMEYNPYGSDDCYGLSKSKMVDWIKDFSDTYKAKTGRAPTIYTSTSWWTACTGNSKSFSENPLWLARYSSSPGKLPASWNTYSIWQYANHGKYPGDQNVWNGSADNLKKFAKGS